MNANNDMHTMHNSFAKFINLSFLGNAHTNGAIIVEATPRTIIVKNNVSIRYFNMILRRRAKYSIPKFYGRVFKGDLNGNFG